MVQSEHVTQSLAGLQVGLKAVCKFRILAHKLICIFRSRFGRFSGVATFHKQPQIMSFSTYVDPLEVVVQPLNGPIGTRGLSQVGLGSAEFW